MGASYPRVLRILCNGSTLVIRISSRGSIPRVRSYFTKMEAKKNCNIDMNIADAIMEKPIGFTVGGRHFCLYPPSLGKNFLVSRLVKQLEINNNIIKENPFLESLRICKYKRELVCRIIAYYTLKSKSDLLNEAIISKRSEYFKKALDENELAQLLITVTSWDNIDSYLKYYGLDKEKLLRIRISNLKKDNCSNVTFGGLSIYGAIIDYACQRYGWTMDYVVWGISYVNLQMLMADAITTVYLSKEEKKKLHIPTDRTYINGDDPNNMQKIKSMSWD